MARAPMICHFFIGSYPAHKINGYHPAS